MNETWQIKETDAALVDRITEEYELPKSIAAILAGRAITEQAIPDFLHPRLQNLSDPFLLPDMDRAVERLLAARALKQQVLIWGDYDVDGICSTSILHSLLRRAGWCVTYFIPDRNKDGYGLTLATLKRLCETAKPDLIVTVDCGTNSVKEVQYASSLNIDVIVTDHHVPATQYAKAYAVLNPKLGRDESFHGLCGAGVVFKLMHALVKQAKDSSDELLAQEDLRNYIDRVALATIADMVPLRGENRILVAYGLKQMKNSNCVGLNALLDVSGITDRVSGSTCAYQLAPRLNATGRMASADQGVELLITSDEGQAHQLALDIDQLNQTRRQAEEQLFKEVVAQVERAGDTENLWGIVLAGENWPVGLVGIAAARAVRTYHVPVILMQTDEKGGAKGSCRSISGVDLLPLLEACSEYLVTFGGHQMAAGVQVKPNGVKDFASCFAAAVQQQLGGIRSERTLEIDVCIEEERITPAWYAQYQKLAPFGTDFREPVVMLRDAQLKGVPRVVGEKHLRFDLAWNKQHIQAIAFNFSIDQLPAGLLDIAGRIEENHWRGEVTLQIQVLSVKPAIRDLI